MRFGSGTLDGEALRPGAGSRPKLNPENAG